MLTSLKRLYL